MTEQEFFRLVVTASLSFSLGLLVMYAVAWKFWRVSDRLRPLDEIDSQ